MYPTVSSHAKDIFWLFGVIHISFGENSFVMSKIKYIRIFRQELSSIINYFDYIAFALHVIIVLVFFLNTCMHISNVYWFCSGFDRTKHLVSSCTDPYVLTYFVTGKWGIYTKSVGFISKLRSTHVIKQILTRYILSFFRVL